MAAHGVPRATGDIDLWVRPTERNAERVLHALALFGAPPLGLSPADLTAPDLVVQIGVAPYRIDLLTGLDGLSFDEAWPRREVLSIGELSIPTLGLRELIRNKEATGRTQDAADVERLRALEKPD
jgi:hypothetical protein